MSRKSTRRLPVRLANPVALLIVFFSCYSANAAKPDIADVEYAIFGSRSLLLDIYQPADRSGPSPLVVWVHGGAWRAGSRASVPVTELTKHGYRNCQY